MEFQDLISNGKTCYASRKITDDKMKVGYMYRDEPEDEDDSGWRFYSGTESEDYVENVDNFMLYDLNTVANIDRSILPLLKKPVGTEWEKDTETGRFNLLE
jgi:hypothetical protein